jgi:phenylacetate-CoA ligase
MNRLLVHAKAAYRRLPPQTYDIAASAYGWYLNRWRYGPETEGLVEAALHRENWAPDRWSSYQDERLAEILHRAATRVPYYRAQWQARRARGDDASWEDLASWPVLQKDALRTQPESFVADDTRLSGLFRLNTSGSSGTPITTWRSRATMRAWYALFEARTRRWYGVDRSMPWAMLGGQLVVPAARTTPPFWVWNSGLRQLYMSTMHLSEANVGAYLDALRRHEVRYLYGYASSLYWLAEMARQRGLEAPQLLVAISNAEPFHPHQRDCVADVFRCRVRDTYGMSEIVAAATECESREMHLWPEVGIVEVLDDACDERVSPPAVGRLVCTGLLNVDMPLVRYEVGDRGALAPATHEPGQCGRRLPQLVTIEGRTNDNLVTADGRRIFWINPVFYELPVREAQVVQESTEVIRVRVVPEEGFDDSVAMTITDRLRERLGEVRVEVERVPAIERGPSGKFQAVINRVAERG